MLYFEKDCKAEVFQLATAATGRSSSSNSLRIKSYVTSLSWMNEADDVAMLMVCKQAHTLRSHPVDISLSIRLPTQSNPIIFFRSEARMAPFLFGKIQMKRKRAELVSSALPFSLCRKLTRASTVNISFSIIQLIQLFTCITHTGENAKRKKSLFITVQLLFFKYIYNWCYSICPFLCIGDLGTTFRVQTAPK